MLTSTLQPPFLIPQLIYYHSEPEAWRSKDSAYRRQCNWRGEGVGVNFLHASEWWPRLTLPVESVPAFMAFCETARGDQGAWTAGVVVTVKHLFLSPGSWMRVLEMPSVAELIQDTWIGCWYLALVSTFLFSCRVLSTFPLFPPWTLFLWVQDVVQSPGCVHLLVTP